MAILLMVVVHSLAGSVAAERSMEVAVRSGIDMADKRKRDKDPAYARDGQRRPRVFLLGSVRESKDGIKLPYLVDAAAIAAELKRKLISQGFRPIRPGETPETVITAEYGMGRLPNPYSDENAGTIPLGGTRPERMHLDDKAYNNLSDSDILTEWRDLSLDPNRTKAVRADAPELIIQVRAWKYPPPANPKKKPTMLWMTTMHVDDPEHRNLNQIYKELLAKGSPYFDQHIERGHELILDTGIPEGTVKIGEPTVVQPKP
ncbi:MAG: hypothetical protein JWM32_2344 [Verrucomicrobia bacterium]|nr:hypothetical protein [Verrucomicrobiota bacterium]